MRNLNERTLLQRASSVLTDRLTWLTACDLFRVIFGLSLFLDVSFACPTYCIPQSELEAFFSLIQIFPSVCSPFILHFSHFSSGFAAICSCLWHLLSSPFHSSHNDSAFYPSTLFSSFPFAFPPVCITPMTDFVALFLDILTFSASAGQPLFSLCTRDAIPPHCTLKFYDLRHTD